MEIHYVGCRDETFATTSITKLPVAALIFLAALAIDGICSMELLGSNETKEGVSSSPSSSSEENYDSASDYNKSAEEEFSYRLSEAGAKRGYLTISLLWHNFNDIDLHCIGPLREPRKFNFKEESKYFNHPAKVKALYSSNRRALLDYGGGLQRWLNDAPKGLKKGDNYKVGHIFFGHKKIIYGEMDVDRNVEPTTRKPVENIFYTEPPRGIYQIYVHHFRNHGDPDPTAYTVQVRLGGKLKQFTGYLRQGDPPRQVHLLRLGGSGKDDLDDSHSNNEISHREFREKRANQRLADRFQSIAQDFSLTKEDFDQKERSLNVLFNGYEKIERIVDATHAKEKPLSIQRINIGLQETKRQIRQELDRLEVLRDELKQTKSLWSRTFDKIEKKDAVLTIASLSLLEADILKIKRKHGPIAVAIEKSRSKQKEITRALFQLVGVLFREGVAFSQAEKELIRSLGN